MKIWTEFSSSHSSDISIIGTFENADEAKGTYGIIEDFTVASWEERHATIDDFINKWKLDYPNLEYIDGLTEDMMNTGVDNHPHIRVVGNEIRISNFRSPNIAGIVRLFLFLGTTKIVIE